MRTCASRSDAAFRQWLTAVSLICAKRFGLTLDDLPDMLTRDAFDAGTPPQEFFDDEVMRVMREDFGPVVDEF